MKGYIVDAKKYFIEIKRIKCSFSINNHYHPQLFIDITKQNLTQWQKSQVTFAPVALFQTCNDNSCVWICIYTCSASPTIPPIMLDTCLVTTISLEIQFCNLWGREKEWQNDSSAFPNFIHTNMTTQPSNWNILCNRLLPIKQWHLSWNTGL